MEKSLKSVPSIKSLYYAMGLLIIFNSCTDASKIARISRLVRNNTAKEETFNDGFEPSSKINGYRIKTSPDNKTYLELSFKNFSNRHYSGLELTMRYRIGYNSKQIHAVLSEKVNSQQRINRIIHFKSKAGGKELNLDQVKIDAVVINRILLPNSLTTDTLIQLNDLNQ